MKRHWGAVLALLAIAAAWGATFTLIKNVLAHIAPEPFIFFRFTLAGVILVAIAWRRGRLAPDLIVPAVTLGMLVFAGYWLQTRALLVISPPRSAFLTGLYVVIVPFCEALVYRVRVPLRAWIASVLAVVGTALLIGGFDARPTFGDLMTVGCAAVFAFHVILSSRYSSRHSAMALAGVQVLVVGIAAAPFAALAPKQPLTGSVIAVIVFTAVVTTALAFTVLMWGQAHVTATEAAVILAFEPVAASITSVMWDREPLTASFLAGATFILGAMVVSQVGGNAKPESLIPNP